MAVLEGHQPSGRPQGNARSIEGNSANGKSLRTLAREVGISHEEDTGGLKDGIMGYLVDGLR